jgi:hypothetical protein
MSQIEAAFAYLQRGELAAAEDGCRQILASTPGDPQAVWLLCDVLKRTDRAAESDVQSAQALTLHPDNPDLLRLRGELLAQQGRDHEAIDFLSKAVERRPVFRKAYEALSAALARRADPTPRFSVTVVTPSIGTDNLSHAIASVQAQDYPHVEHLVVADGPQYEARVRAAVPPSTRHRVHLLTLPNNTGGDGFNGHRIYAAAPYLVDTHFAAFLDEDNWLDNDHLSSLMAVITAGGLSWAYALRKIVGPDGRYIAHDDCDSLGHWPTWDRPDLHLVDTNCYLLRRDVAVAVGPAWYRRRKDNIDPDMSICHQLLRGFPRCATSGRHTVNYRAGMTEYSAKVDYFLAGNAAMQKRHGDQFPWRQAK